MGKDCQERTIGETEAAVIDAATARFRSLGVTHIDFAHTLDGKVSGRLYVLSGSHVSMFLSSEGLLIQEIRFALSDPSTGADRDAQASMASFFIARLSGVDERDARDQLLDAEASAPNHGEPKLLRYPRNVVAIVSKFDEQNIVLTIGELECR